MSSKLSHYDDAGRARMVDVSAKTANVREAEASAFVAMSAQVLGALGRNPKGDPLETARLAGIMAAKKTSDLIPLCHPIPLTDAGVDIEADRTLPGLRVTGWASTHGRTGVEMEALTAVSVALLTIYDMAKAIDRGMQISGVRLSEKRGGRSGDWKRD